MDYGIRKTRYEQDRAYYYMVSIFVNAKMLVDMVRYASELIMPQLVSYVELLRNVLYVGCGLYMVYLWLRYEMIKRDFGVLCITVYIWLFSCIANPKVNSFAGSALLIFFSRVFVGYFYFANLRDYQKLCQIQRWFCIPTLIYTFMVFQFEQSSGYIAVSYNLMPMALFYLFMGLSEHKHFYTISALVIAVVVLLYGSRGSVMCGVIAVAIYMVITMIRNGTKVKTKDIILFLTALIVVLLVVVNFNRIANILLSKYTSSRTLKMYLAGHITSDSGRSKIYEGILRAIKDEPFFPHGLLSDRIVVASSRGVNPNYLTYPHNYIYELCYQFGIPLAVLFLLSNILLVFRWIKKSMKMDDKRFVFCMAFIPIAFTQLFVSSSYLVSYMWGIAMGMLVAQDGRKIEKRDVG